ncbi:flavin reductase [Intestinibacter sp.]
MNNKAMYKIGYGLYIVTAEENDKHNGCIINTTMQVTTTPNRISITVNKQNKTHDMIKNSGKFNVSVLTEKANFDLFKHFGFQSGANVDKFEGYKDAKKSSNGLYYITDSTNAFISGEVVQSVDLGTHTMFIADVVDAEVLSDDKSVTYDYYQENIKPKPEANKVKKGYRCVICGYIYEGEELPPDYVCPICKHGASDFEEIKQAKKSYRCVICGYVYEGEELPPDYICPICKHGVSDFEEI